MFGFNKKFKTALEYQKERRESTYLIEQKAQRDRDIRDSETYRDDLKNRCPKCGMIRSSYEVSKGTCNNCD